MQPFAIVENKWFKEFVAKLNPSYTLPSRKTLSNGMLNVQYELLKLQVKKQLERTSAVSITTDTWTSRANSDFIALTCHFVDDKSGGMKSLLLECRRLKKNHTSVNLAKVMKAALNKWGVFDKTVCFTTDNAANITGAVGAEQFERDWSRETEMQKNCNALQIEHAGEQGASENADGNKMKTLRVKQDVVTRWNSTLAMFLRLIEVR